MAGILGRSLPIRPHLAKPIVTPLHAPFAGPVVIGQSLRTPYRHLQRFKPHLAPPIVDPNGPVKIPRVVPHTFFTIARDQRTRHLQRFTPHLAKPIVDPNGPVKIPRVIPHTFYVGRDVRTAHLQRFRPHLAKPIVDPNGPVRFPRVTPHTTYTTTNASYWRTLGRSVPYRPHLAPPIVPQPPDPFLIQIMVTRQARLRALIGRFPPRPHLAPPNLSPILTPVPRGTFVYQSRIVRRPFIYRPHLTRPITGGQPLTVTQFTRGSYTYQSLRRPYIGRTTPAPHLAPANLAPPPLLFQVIVSQVISGTRAIYRRPTPRPHLPSLLTLLPPLTITPRSVTTYQSLRRPYLLRTTPRPHYASPIVTPLGPPLLTRATSLTTQSRRRALILRTVPKPHLAPPITGGQPLTVTQFTTPTLRYQALARAYIGRMVLRAHLAPTNLSPPAALTDPLVIQVMVTRQAILRSFLYRSVPPRPHLAPGLLDDTTLLFSQIIVSQAIERAKFGRNVPYHPHYAKPIITPIHPPFPPAKIFSQALKRSHRDYSIRWKYPHRPIVLPVFDPVFRRPLMAMYHNLVTSATYKDIRTAALYTVLLRTRALYTSDSYTRGSNMATVTIKQNDRSPSLAATLTQGGAIIDLTGCTVKLIARSRRTPATVKINSGATVVSPTAGTVQYDWGVSDTDTVEDYQMEWEITLTSGKKVTVPNDGYDILSVLDDIA